MHAQSPRQPYSDRDTWYEFLLKKCNPSNFNYGAWLEQRRRAFLEASIKEPYFWYSFAVTAGVLILMAAYAKLSVDHRHTVRVTEEMMADLYSHDLCSRGAAKEAIEKYNQHIEQCNRAAESRESGDGRPGWGTSEVEVLKAELQRVANQLEATTQDRNKLQEELRQKSLVVADLSIRLDALSKKMDGVRGSGTEARQAVAPDETGDGTRFVGQINRLQEELYAERQKNKRLKGA
jgi:predicted RNase H-like nuclease (RuvC/YqgF family)